MPIRHARFPREAKEEEDSVSENNGRPEADIRQRNIGTWFSKEIFPRDDDWLAPSWFMDGRPAVVEGDAAKDLDVSLDLQGDVGDSDGQRVAIPSSLQKLWNQQLRSVKRAAAPIERPRSRFTLNGSFLS